MSDPTLIDQLSDRVEVCGGCQRTIRAGKPFKRIVFNQDNEDKRGKNQCLGCVEVKKSKANP